MRNTLILALAACCLSSNAFAQAEKARPEIKKIQIGFQTHDKDEVSATKVGLWTPVYIEVFGGADGIDNKPDNYLELETVDSEDVGTIIRVPVSIKRMETDTVIGYVKIGRQSSGGGEVRVTLHANGRKFEKAIEQFGTLEIDAHLYLTLGARLFDLHRAVYRMDRPPDDKEKEVADPRFDPHLYRHVVFENKVDRLPKVWHGYNGVDLIILTTESRPFLTGLKNDTDRLAALAQWVRRGGRLVVPIAHGRQDAVSDLLSSPVWHPPIPVVPPNSPGNVQALALPSLTQVSHWGKAPDFQLLDAAQRPIPIEVARLDDGKVSPGAWDVIVRSGEDTGDRPLITRVRYGLGQIVYMAFSFEDRSFTAWPGREKFLQTMIQKLAPPRTAGNAEKDFGFGGRRNEATDTTTSLLTKLDDFDVKVIPFGYVALFIVLYILVVGPLDFVLLKYVFKRLEWTWITFPAVVLAVSVIAYFAAYALKGRDLKINKVDIVDFDLRTNPNDVHAYGHSFFTILSPRIQNYTVGLEVNPAFWGEKADKVRSVDLLGWLGRPSGGPHAMGRGGSTGFFKRPYTFRADAAAVEGVPIPVWTTKAFCASWEQTLKSKPFVVDLRYYRKPVQGKDIKLKGKLENHLAVDLTDVWLIYDDRCFPIEGGLKSVREGPAPGPFVLSTSNEEVKNWVNLREGADQASEPRTWNSNPTSLIKTIMFHERSDTQRVLPNHLLRSIDLGWRIQEERPALATDRSVREAILFARVQHATGPSETVTTDPDLPLPTKLWLGDTPDPARSRPALIGQLNQDTYIRVILPVRPADE